MKLADFPGVRALSPREKLQLMDELWQDVAPELESLEVTEAEKRLLDQRWSAFLGDPTRALTVEDFQERLKNRRK